MYKLATFAVLGVCCRLNPRPACHGPISRAASDRLLAAIIDFFVVIYRQLRQSLADSFKQAWSQGVATPRLQSPLLQRAVRASVA
ncbi:MAG: hypothetical protein ACI85K_001871 [Hyphomicrobiaceae bacterium]|jgi:hypothetical protein